MFNYDEPKIFFFRAPNFDTGAANEANTGLVCRRYYTSKIATTTMYRQKKCVATSPLVRLKGTAA